MLLSSLPRRFFLVYCFPTPTVLTLLFTAAATARWFHFSCACHRRTPQRQLRHTPRGKRKRRARDFWPPRAYFLSSPEVAMAANLVLAVGC